MSYDYGCGWLHNSELLKATELYTLNGQIVWYVNSISIKLGNKSSCTALDTTTTHPTRSKQKALRMGDFLHLSGSPTIQLITRVPNPWSVDQYQSVAS